MPDYSPGNALPREPMHAWIITGDFLFKLFERVTLLAAIYAVGLVTKNGIVLTVYAMATMALILSAQAEAMKIARAEGAFMQRGFANVAIMAILFALMGLISFGVPKIVTELAKSVEGPATSCK